MNAGIFEARSEEHGASSASAGWSIPFAEVMETNGLFIRKPKCFDRHQVNPNALSALLKTSLTEKGPRSRSGISRYFDSVTGLPNREFMRKLLKNALANAKRYGRFVGVLFLDLDHFKRVNDTLGHEAGDSLLREVAHRLKGTLRSSDSLSRTSSSGLGKGLIDPGGNAIARLGGDEFVTILTEVAHPENCGFVARRLANALSDPISIGSQKITLSASVGISVYPMDGHDEVSLIKNADNAMYKAKQEGRNRIHFFTSSLDEESRKRLSIEVNLRKALDQDALSLAYQPKVDVRTNRVVGVEALLRWHDHELGDVSPSEFIPIAEDTGLILDLGGWVLREACSRAAAWRAAGLSELSVAVNLSAVQFRDEQLIRRVEQALAESGLDPQYLELELTEGALIRDVHESTNLLKTLKSIGVNISVDDFGTGYSSLSYLKHFPIDTLKIDRSFVQGIPADSDNAAIAKAIIALGHSLRLIVVAEGIENKDQLEFLMSAGCDEIQGFYFSYPLPPDELADWVQQHFLASCDPAC